MPSEIMWKCGSYTLGSTPRTGDQPVKSPPTQDNAKAEEMGSRNQGPSCFSEGRYLSAWNLATTYICDCIWSQKSWAERQMLTNEWLRVFAVQVLVNQVTILPGSISCLLYTLQVYKYTFILNLRCLIYVPLINSTFAIHSSSFSMLYVYIVKIHKLVAMVYEYVYQNSGHCPSVCLVF
jgi:hypothetical protein